MSSVRRPLLTATAAGTLLGALWFVPSANASQDTAARADTAATRITQQARAVSEAATDETTTSGTATDGAATDGTTTDEASDETASASADGTRLADTGSPDTTPYVVGGAFFLTLGAGFVVYSVRRERLDF